VVMRLLNSFNESQPHNVLYKLELIKKFKQILTLIHGFNMFDVSSAALAYNPCLRTGSRT